MLGSNAARSLRSGGAAVKLQQRGFAENLNAIKMRIASTGNIQKITKSMKMVSAAKLRGDTDRLMNGRPFNGTMDALFSATPSEADLAEGAHVPEIKKPMYVCLSSDRGLCGGINTFVAKEAKICLERDLAAGKEPLVFVAGDKASAQLARSNPDQLVGQILERAKTPVNFSKALFIADRVISARPDADAIEIVYNQFFSAIRYETTRKTVLNLPKLTAGEDESAQVPFPFNKYEGELESTSEAMQNLYEYGLAVQLYGCMVESATSEQSSRMQAMENASKNATEMVEKLTVKYNRARQAKITTELIEIISGAESLKG